MLDEATSRRTVDARFQLYSSVIPSFKGTSTFPFPGTGGLKHAFKWRIIFPNKEVPRLRRARRAIWCQPSLINGRRGYREARRNLPRIQRKMFPTRLRAESLRAVSRREMSMRTGDDSDHSSGDLAPSTSSMDQYFGGEPSSLCSVEAL